MRLLASTLSDASKRLRVTPGAPQRISSIAVGRVAAKVRHRNDGQQFAGVPYRLLEERISFDVAPTNQQGDDHGCSRETPGCNPRPHLVGTPTARDHRDRIRLADLVSAGNLARGPGPA